MDTELLADERIEEGRQLIAELIRDGSDVSVAFWIKTSDEGLWHFYISSPLVEAARAGNVYPRLFACLRRLHAPWLTITQIKVVPADSSVATDAIAVRDRFAARIPTRLRGRRFGDLSFQEAYVYPRMAGPMTRSEVLQTFIGLMDRSGSMSPSIVTLQDGSAIRATPISIDKETTGGAHVVLRDLATGVDRIVSPDDVANVQ